MSAPVDGEKIEVLFSDFEAGARRGVRVGGIGCVQSVEGVRCWPPKYLPQDVVVLGTPVCSSTASFTSTSRWRSAALEFVFSAMISILDGWSASTIVAMRTPRSECDMSLLERN